MDPELERMRMRLHEKKNVVATGVGYKVIDGETTDQLAMIVSVSHKVSPDELTNGDLIPRWINGLPTDVVETGPIEALNLHRTRSRPAIGGISIGHRYVTTGTLGCLVERGGDTFILSNNHVLADCGRGKFGDYIYQPGTYDGGTPIDTIAFLEDFVPIVMSDGTSEGPSTCPVANSVARVVNSLAKVLKSDARMVPMSVKPRAVYENLVDAAIARPVEPGLVEPLILGVGLPLGVGHPYLGCKVQKSGRTTGFTTGEIIQTMVTVDVDFGDGKTARFKDQFMLGPISEGGDSGSAVLDMENNVVGLLFAGSAQVTLCNTISNVCTQLGVRPVIPR